MLVLTHSATAVSLHWSDAVEALRRGHMQPRAEIGDVLLGPRSGILLNRAAFIEGIGYAVKAETVVPSNPARGLPTVQGAVLLYAPDTGAPRAVIESSLVTEYKTAGDSVLGARLLARPESRHLAILGSGVMATCLARAYAAVFPGLERISVWARRPEQAESFVEIVDVGIPMVAVPDLRTALVDADIVSSATAAREPIIHGFWVRAGTHVDLVGAYLPDMREADDGLMSMASVFVDNRETTRLIGEIAAPIASGAVASDYVRGDLYDLIASDASARGSEEEVTVFKNGGGAHLDLMIANYIARVSGLLCTDLPVHAERKGQRGPWRRRSTTRYWTNC